MWIRYGCCTRRHEPYRKFVTFEMKRKNFVEVQSVLLQGAHAVVVESSDSSSRLVRLFYTWGVCEYHLVSHSRAEQLLDDVLPVTGSEGGIIPRCGLSFPIP